MKHKANYLREVLLLLALLVSLSMKGQDTIFKRNGEHICAKVLKVGPDVVYKRADFLNGPDYLLLKNDVEAIHYANGEWDRFEELKVLVEEAHPNELSGIGYYDSIRYEKRKRDLHYRNNIFINAPAFIFRSEPNLGYEYFLKDRLSVSLAVSYKLQSDGAVSFFSENSMSINPLYSGPSIQAGIRRYEPGKHVFFGVGLKYSYLTISDGALYTMGGSSYGEHQDINYSTRNDLDLKVSFGWHPRKVKHHLRMTFLAGVGLRYSHAVTSASNLEYNESGVGTPATKDMPMGPAYIGSPDVIPRGNYFVPCIQLGVLIGFGFGIMK
jgi:hypothetical protein